MFVDLGSEEKDGQSLSLSKKSGYNWENILIDIKADTKNLNAYELQNLAKKEVYGDDWHLISCEELSQRLDELHIEREKEETKDAENNQITDIN